MTKYAPKRDMKRDAKRAQHKTDTEIQKHSHKHIKDAKARKHKINNAKRFKTLKHTYTKHTKLN